MLTVVKTHHEVEFVQAMQTKGIKVIAYRPLQFLPNCRMASDMGDTTIEVLKAEAELVKAKSEEQLVLAWLMKRGCHVLVKSST